MLLQQYAGDGYIKSSPELVTLAKKFVARFGANPLNLKAFGGLLYHADTVLLDLEKLGRKTVPCLQLCHDVLPKHLKNCLAFCSLFPKGYIFDKHYTVLLWLSRGFIVPVEGRGLEYVGVEYFRELLYRSFFQYSPSHEYKEGKFVVHELIYNVVLSVSYDKYFKYEDLPSRVPENIRHVSLVYSQFQTVQLMPKTEELKDLQTFLVVQPEWHWQQYKISFPTLNLVGLDDFFLKFTSLETMDLSHTDIEELPGSIAGLRNLQYLSLNGTSIRALPSELCSLRNLQTLKAKDCRFLTELPGDTKELLKLRHLDVTKELGYVHLPHGVEQLTELRTLPVFHASGDSSHCSILT
uniref:NB-ARC domain-containing protein n=1 Tax=Arundo donax TaxID=35708 RepID=A0A0A9G5L0_ARUDO